MMPAPIQLLFNPTLLLTEALVGVLLMLSFTLLMLPSILRAGAKTADVAKASYGYIAQTIGIFLMTVSGLPAFYSAVSSMDYASGTYAGLLTIFAVGGLLFLWQDGLLRKIDPAARMLPQVVFTHLWKLIGLLAVLAAGLSCAFFLFTNTAPLQSGWWIYYAGLFVYGILVSWLTLDRPGRRSPIPFSSIHMHTSAAATVKKPIAKKVKKTKKRA